LGFGFAFGEEEEEEDFIGMLIGIFAGFIIYICANYFLKECMKKQD
jgi:hypothetical protein